MLCILFAALVRLGGFGVETFWVGCNGPTQVFVAARFLCLAGTEHMCVCVRVQFCSM